MKHKPIKSPKSPEEIYYNTLLELKSLNKKRDWEGMISLIDNTVEFLKKQEEGELKAAKKAR